MTDLTKLAVSSDIRVCVAGDEQALSLVGQATFLETFAGVIHGSDVVAHCTQQHAPAVYRKWLDSTSARAWLVEIPPSAAPVGYMVVAPPDLPLADLNEADLEIKRIYVLRRFQGTGLGRRLVAAAVHHARQRAAGRLLLGVLGRNDAAIAFYERIGFQRAGERRFRVGDHVYDDLIFSLDLAASD